MKKKLSVEEVERRWAEIDSRPPVSLTEEEAASLAEAEAVNDGSFVSMEEFKASLEGYSGKLVLRIPKTLHKALKEAAEIEGVSLNQYMLYKLAK